MDTWKVIVEAGKIRSYAPALKLSESKSLPNESNGLPPDILSEAMLSNLYDEELAKTYQKEIPGPDS